MYPSNGIQDTSSFLFSDNMCTNPSSTIEDFSSSSLLNIVFPSSHLVDFNDNTVFFQDFHDILHQKVNGQEMDQEIVTYEGASNISMSKIDVKKKKLSCGGSSKLCEQIRVKRKCHKDRHSKITTANGSSRGRRMRLSLNVAKEFFALQDMLEFDKASKTVEWLLKNSENSIKEETMKRAKMSHIPCPSTSAIDPEPPTSKEKTRGTQKVSATHPVTRGSRGKARARARERTQKKKQLQLVGGVTDINDRSRLYNCSQGMNIGSDHPSLNCEKSSAAGNKFLDMGARARERTQKQKQLQLVGGVTDNDRSRLHNCSQGMNIGSDHSSLNCKKSAAAGNKFLDMRNGSPAPVLEFEDILNYSKQQPHSFEGIEN